MEDGYSRKSVEVMGKEVRGPVHVETYYGVGHGSKMLAREPKLEVLMTSWFLGTVISADGRSLDDAGKPVTEGMEAQATGLDTEAARRQLEEDAREADESKAEALEDDEDASKGRRWELENED